MKKAIAVLFTLSTLTMSLYGYNQTDRIQDMQTMETAMAKIQKGILYNDKKIVIEGVKNLEKASANVEVAPKGDMDYSPVYAKQQSKNIMKYAEKIKSNIEENRKHSASSNYTKVLGECISCHNKLRKWD